MCCWCMVLSSWWTASPFNSVIFRWTVQLLYWTVWGMKACDGLEVRLISRNKWAHWLAMHFCLLRSSLTADSTINISVEICRETGGRSWKIRAYDLEQICHLSRWADVEGFVWFCLIGRNRPRFTLCQLMVNGYHFLYWYQLVTQCFWSTALGKLPLGRLLLGEVLHRSFSSTKTLFGESSRSYQTTF